MTFLSVYLFFREVKEKAKKLIEKVRKLERTSDRLENAIQSANSLDEIEVLATPFKSSSKQTLANKARELGLENVANQYLHHKMCM
jgi:Tex-like protein N-terminal domain.